MTFADILWQLVQNFGSFGLVSWLTSGAYIQYKQLKKGELSNDEKRVISIAVPVLVVGAAYFLGAGLGYWPVDERTIIQALFPIFAELGGGKLFFTASKAAEGKAERPL